MPLQHTYLSCRQHLYSHYYLCHYLPASSGRDHLSHSLLKFKKSRQPDLDAWIDCSLELLAQAPIPPGATVIRALHHYETTASTHSSLDLLGQELARQFRHRYLPLLLQKTHPNQPVKMFSKPRREEELQGLYRLHPSLLPSAPSHWLVIDDILTSGATLHAILQAIQEAGTPGPANTPIHIFTLARAATTPPLHPTPLKGRQYQFEEAGGAWTLAEDQIPYYSLAQLKSIILRDAF
jgi:predicted amidophosphoribosyltransferase